MQAVPWLVLQDRRAGFALTLALALLFGAPALRATTFLILPDGTGDFPTIQAGISAVAVTDGDILELADGTFSGPGNRDIDYLGKAITIRSRSGNPEACVIDAEFAGRGVFFQSNEGPDSRLERVTITHGSAPEGGGVYCLPGCSPSFTGCRFENNTTTGRGGGLLFRGGSSSVTDCVFSGNSAGAGGGCYALSATATLDGCSFIGNTAEFGGGANIQASAGPVSGCVFEDNVAVERGGGLYIWSANPASVTGCVFTGNRAHEGAGIQLMSYASCEIHDDEFTGNQAPGRGGAIQLLNWSTADVRDCAFTGNDAHEGACVSLELGSSAVIQDCTLLRNTGFWGAGVGVRDAGSVTLVGCVVGENEAINRAAALYASEATAVLNDCTIYRNHASTYGGALCAFQSTISAGWCTFSENRSDSAGVFYGFGNSSISMQRSILAFSPTGPAIACGFEGTADLICCDVFGNAGGDWVGCLEAQNGVHGNFAADPLFCDPPNGDFTLARGSLCASENSPFGCGPVGAWPVGCDVPRQEWLPMIEALRR